MGKAVVIHAAMVDCVQEPLHDSVKNAADRAEKSGAGGKKKKDKGLTQTLYGKDVSELIPELDAQDKQRADDAEERNRKHQEVASARASKQTDAIAKACAHLVAKRDADKLSIADLITLLKWKGAAVPSDHSKKGKPAMVRAWTDLAVSDEVIAAQASEAAEAPPPAPKQKQKRRRAVESDDEESDGEDESDGEGDGSEDESEDESDEEEMYTVKQIIDKKGKGKKTQYLVEWEPELTEDGSVRQTWEPNWEPACNVTQDLIMDYEQSERSRKKAQKK